MRLYDSTSRGLRRDRCPTILQAIMLMGILPAQPSWGHAESVPREQIIPILAATTGESAIGIIVYLVVAFEEGTGRSGLHVIFHTAPGRFSLLMQTAIQEVVLHVVQSLDLSPDSWTVALTGPYPDVTIGGDSLFGMVMLSVAALVATNAANVRRVLVSDRQMARGAHIGGHYRKREI